MSRRPAGRVAILGAYRSAPGQRIRGAVRSVRAGPAGLELLDLRPQPNPSALAFHPTRAVVYAVSERAPGAVVAYEVSETDGRLRPTDAVATGDDGPCHCAVGPRGQLLLVAHYTGGSVAAIDLRADGGFAGPARTHRHTGSGPNPDRQRAAHPHAVVFVTDELVYVPDLGADRLVVYELDHATSRLQPLAGRSVACPAGAGPRQLAVHARVPVGYLLCELDGSLLILDLETPERPSISGAVATLPSEALSGPGGTSAAAVAVHPAGYLYCSTRGHDSITVFDLERPRKPVRRAVVSSGGARPRTLTIAPNGQRLYVCHPPSDGLDVFDLDPETGTLTPSTEGLLTPAPASLRFLSE